MLIISSQELEIIKAILQRYVPEHSVWAFGSRVKGTTKPYSDLDLAIITNTPLNLQTHADLVAAFSECELPWRVDLVDWSLTSEKFKQIILNCYEVIQ